MGRRLYVSAVALLATSALVFSGTFFGGVAQAQQQSGAPNSANGLRISPVRQDLQIEPGKSQTVDVYVENITDSPADFRGVVNDFIAGDDETGKPKVLFDEQDYAPSHGLRRFVAPISDFKLAPKERRAIKVTVSIPQNAAGGGYYGAVRFLPSNTNARENVTLSASVGSLLLVTVPGDVKEQLGVESLNVSRGDGKASSLFTNGNELKSVVRFKNSGNVQLSPFGKVVLKKSGKEIASYEINNTTPRGSVLPDSIRRFEVGFGDKAKSLGKYTIEGNFGYGSRGHLISASSTFYVVPLPFVVLAILLIAIILFLIFALPRLIKNHDRNLLRKMRGRK